MASYPYSYSGAPSYYYHPQHTGPVWPPPQPPQAWPVPQPPQVTAVKWSFAVFTSLAQSWPAQEPPPPGTGGENSQAPLPSEETEESKAAAAPAVSGWQTSYWHQHWPPPGPVCVCVCVCVCYSILLSHRYSWCGSVEWAVASTATCLLEHSIWLCEQPEAAGRAACCPASPAGLFSEQSGPDSTTEAAAAAAGSHTPSLWASGR